MKIMFTLTKQDTWSYYKYATWKLLQSHPFYYFKTWTWGFMISWLGFAVVYYLIEKDFLFGLALTFIQCFLGAIGYAVSTRHRYFKSIASDTGWLGDRVVELGKFDLRWGSLESDGYYYHWSALSDVVETGAYLYLIIQNKGALIVPKSAFSDPAEAQAFVTEVRARWETAKQRQRYASTSGEGVWPPPPRIGA